MLLAMVSNLLPYNQKLHVANCMQVYFKDFGGMVVGAIGLVQHTDEIRVIL